MAAIAFVDTETSGLDPRRHAAWEIAVIRREDGYDAEHLWQVRIPLDTADPDALDIGKYHTRFAVRDGWDAAEMSPARGDAFINLTLPEFLFDLQDALHGTVMVGSNPAFDDAFLKKLLQANGRRIGWHYRPVDIATLAAGYLYGALTMKAGGDRDFFADDYPTLPFSSRGLSRELGVEPPGDDVAHTALGDARWARDVFDAVVGKQPAERAA